jgi:short subunit dehydrogenase-like uncharacterized protein
MSKRLNFIIFGATGYTGKIVVNELALAAKKHEFTWGIAGRSYDKLKQVLNSVSTKNSKYMIYNLYFRVSFTHKKLNFYERI